MRLVERTYLHMLTPCVQALEACPPGVEIVLQRPMPLSRYRFLYACIGAAWHWTDRLAWSDEELGRYLADPTVFTFVLEKDSEPAGLVEFQTHAADTQIQYFGLRPEFMGHGLGRYLLHWSVHHAWETWKLRLWLHTCTLDAPSALPNYVGRGFEVFRVETYRAAIHGHNRGETSSATPPGEDSQADPRTL